MKKLLLKAAAALLCAVGLSICAQGQMTTITASSIKMGGAPIAAGSVTLTPVDAKGKPIPFVQAGGGLNSAHPFTCKIQNGAITGICQVPDSAITTPAHISYSIQISSTPSQKAFVMNAVPNITGSTWALDDYAPAANTTNVEPIQVSYGTAAPPETCVAPSFYVRNASGGLLYMCVNQVWVLVTGSGGGSASVTPESMSSAVATLTGCSDPAKSWSPAANACVSNTGPQGPKGDTGAAGAKGDTGPEGPKGDTGETGETGPAGSSATVAVGTVTSGDAGSDAAVTNAGTSSTAVLNFTIPRGADGAPGPKGDQGPQGEAGAQGPKGDQGVAGPTGATGETGPAGAKGDQGLKGDKGDPGNVGPTGPKGDTGDQGPQGLQGQKGDKGDPGVSFWSCQPGLGDGVNTIAIGTYTEWTCRNSTGSTIALTGISCIADAGSSTVSMTNGFDTALLSAPVSCGTSYTAGTQSATTTLADGDFIKLTIAAAGSKQVSVDVKGTL